MSKIPAIKAAWTAHAAATVGVAAARDHEPRELPKLPCVTMLMVQQDPMDVATGGCQDVEYVWRINVYVDRTPGYRQAQERLEDIVSELLKITRADHNLGGSCEWAQLRDDGAEPVFPQEHKYVVKSLRLEVRAEESP